MFCLDAETVCRIQVVIKYDLRLVDDLIRFANKQDLVTAHILGSNHNRTDIKILILTMARRGYPGKPQSRYLQDPLPLKPSRTLKIRPLLMHHRAVQILFFRPSAIMVARHHHVSLISPSAQRFK